MNVICRRLLGAAWLSLILSAAAQAAPASSSATEAMATLSSAETLESPRIGFAATPSPQFEELLTLLASEQSPALLKQLFATGTRVAQVYALIGLQLAGDEAGFAQLFASLEAVADESLPVLEGCVFSNMPLRDVLAAVATGRYTESWPQYEAQESP